MNCRYVNKWHGMFCVDESFDSSEDSDEYSTGDSSEDEYLNEDSQEGEIMVKFI